MIIRSISNAGDVELVDADGSVYRFTISPICGSQILSGQFVAGMIREGRAGVVTRWLAPKMVASNDGARYVDMELQRNRQWFREMMARIMFAK